MLTESLIFSRVANYVYPSDAVVFWRGHHKSEKTASVDPNAGDDDDDGGRGEEEEVVVTALIPIL